MHKLLELRSGYVHAYGLIEDNPDSYTMCGLDCSAIEPKDGKKFTEEEIYDDLCPAMEEVNRRVTCPSCLSLAKFVLENSREFKAAIKSAEKNGSIERL